MPFNSVSLYVNFVAKNRAIPFENSSKPIQNVNAINLYRLPIILAMTLPNYPFPCFSTNPINLYIYIVFDDTITRLPFSITHLSTTAYTYIFLFLFTQPRPRMINFCREPGKVLLIPDHIGDGGRPDVSGARHRSPADPTAPSQKASAQPSNQPNVDDWWWWVGQRRNATTKRVRG